MRPLRSRPVVALVLGSAVLLAATCVSGVTGPDQTLWEAALEGGPEHPFVTGSAAAVTTDQRTTVASIAVEGLPEGMYPWRIRSGDCEDPGDLIGVEEQYPDLGVSGAEEDTPSVEAALGSPMTAGIRYHAEVREAESGVLLACGGFVQVRQ